MNVVQLFEVYDKDKTSHLRPYLHITADAPNHPVIYDKNRELQTARCSSSHVYPSGPSSSLLPSPFSTRLSSQALFCRCRQSSTASTRRSRSRPRTCTLIRYGPSWRRLPNSRSLAFAASLSARALTSPSSTSLSTRL